MGLVAQWTRARGYEPRCRGFDSLLALLVKFTKIYKLQTLMTLTGFEPVTLGL